MNIADKVRGLTERFNPARILGPLSVELNHFKTLEEQRMRFVDQHPVQDFTRSPFTPVDESKYNAAERFLVSRGYAEVVGTRVMSDSLLSDKKRTCAAYDMHHVKLSEEGEKRYSRLGLLKPAFSLLN